MSISNGERSLAVARKCFHAVKDPRKAPLISMPDTLMAALAIYSLKIPSLLKFEEIKKKEALRVENLKSIYSITSLPSDTQMRAILDPVNPEEIRPAFKMIFNELQQSKKLEQFKFLGGYYLLAIDGTGYYHSTSIKCDSCMVYESEKTGVSYRHHMLGASIVHPMMKEVIPLCPEAIRVQDGIDKNDHERVAAKRLLTKFREDHPRLKVIVIEDALFSNGPHIQMLLNHEVSFILAVKELGNASLFSFVETAKRLDRFGSHEEIIYTGQKIQKKTVHNFTFINHLSLNFERKDMKVNFLEYSETTTWTDTKGVNQEQKKKFSWITDIELNKNNVMTIMRGGRCRWKIENETFNTLKTQGYNFEHNYGHGYKNLCTNFAYLMMLAFLIDQSQQLCCPLYQKISEYAGGKKYQWEKIKIVFEIFTITSWTQLLRGLYDMSTGKRYELDTT